MVAYAENDQTLCNSCCRPVPWLGKPDAQTAAHSGRNLLVPSSIITFDLNCNGFYVMEILTVAWSAICFGAVVKWTT